MTTNVAPDTRPRRRFQWKTLLGLTVVWVLLWGELSAANVASGLIVSAFVIMVFPAPPVGFAGRARPVGLLLLAGHFVADLVVASAQVSAQALRFGQPPVSAVVNVHLRTSSDLYLTLTAQIISLIPGSVVVEARRSSSTLFLHVLGVRDSADVERARARALRQETRVLRALGSAAELEEHRRRTGGVSR